MLSERWATAESAASIRAADIEFVAPSAPRPDVALPYPERFEICRDWLDDAHRRFVARLFSTSGDRSGANDYSFTDALPRFVFVPRSQPERAHTVDPRNFDDIAVVAAFSKQQWFVQDTAIDTELGPTGRLQVRLRAEWIIGPPAIRCPSLRPRMEPACIVTATADLPLEAREPRLLNCVVCYDDARLGA